MTIKEKRGKVRNSCIGYTNLHMCGTTCPLIKPKGAYDAQYERFGCLTIGCASESDLDKALELIAKHDAEKPTKKANTTIKDSGDRRQFESGAVRDIQEGKGRCDLLPLDVVSNYLSGNVILQNIEQFKESGDTDFLYIALSHLDQWDPYTTILEVSKHFEEGSKKYSENNWKLGINAKHYIDSGTRHYLKWLRGDNDEPHDRAFCWNILCCIWTCVHKPELNDYRKASEDEK